MTRTELYALVWARPMMHVAPELGLSGPGLAKLCERHAIPTPPRGHWSKLRAGKRSRPAPLPQPTLDTPVGLPSAAQRQRREEVQAFERTLRASGHLTAVAQSAAASNEAVPSEQRDAAPAALAALRVADALEQPHPLVRATAAVVQRLPAQLARFERATPSQRASASFKLPPLAHRGRHELDVPGGLALTASLASMDWVLRFLDALLKGLRAVGLRLERSTQPGDRVAPLRLHKDGEVLMVSPVVESFNRREVEPVELAELQRKDSWADKCHYTPSGRFSLSVQGTERIVHTRWAGTSPQLEARLGDIVATCVDLLQRQPAYRQEREAREAQRQQEAERQATRRRQEESRQKLLARAFEASQQHEQELALRRFLAMVEQLADDFQEPYPERAKVWLTVVRAQLEKASPWRCTLGEMLAGHSWQPWPPNWWPSSQEGGVDR